MAEPKPYDDLVMDHIRNARNYRALKHPDRQAEGINPMCGDELLVSMKLDGDRLSDVAFQCTCCGVSMASASIMTEMLQGLPVEQAKSLVSDVTNALRRTDAESAARHNEGIAAIVDTVTRFPARARCGLLPWATAEAALNGRDSAVVP